MPRAFVFSKYGGPEVCEFVDLPVPEPGSGQAVVKVRAAGVNPADWKRRRGGPQAAPLEEPVVMGRELSGVIEAVGTGVSGFAVGDAVFGVPAAGGAFAEYSVLAVDQMAKKSPQVSFVDAATLGVAGATAYDGITQLDPKAGETILIVGIGGGVGVAAAQIAKHRGAKVIGTASAPKKDLVESLGATHVTYGDGVEERLRAAAPDGVDAVFDMVGGEALRQAAALVKDPARLISIGDAATAASLGAPAIDRKRNSAVLEEVDRLVASGVLKPSVTQVFPLDKVDEALALVEGGHAAGKVVVEVD